MKISRSYLTMFLSLISSWCFSQINSDSSIAKHYLTKKSDIAIFPADSKELFYGNERFTPTQKEIDQAERALVIQLPRLNAEHVNQYATPVIDKNLSKYKRQYFGYIDKNGNRILYINCFWKRDKEGEQLWLREKIQVLDGGSYYWNIKFNINTDELFDLDVNGDV